MEFFKYCNCNFNFDVNYVYHNKQKEDKVFKIFLGLKTNKNSKPPISFENNLQHFFKKVNLN